MKRKLWWPQGILSLGLAFSLANCDSIEDPDAVSFKDLKAPGGLSITDNGDGSIQLSWLGSNNEDDFEGYNVYGAKGSAATLGITEGSAIQLLDEGGEPRNDAKETLAKFDYKPDSPFALYGANTARWLLEEEAAAATEEDEKDKKFTYLPIHTLNDKNEPVLPTCQPGSLTGGVSSCTNTDKDNPIDEDSVTMNGTSTYDISGLTPGQSYCFFVFAVQDGGEEISQTSSEIKCVVPRVQVSESAVTINSVNARYKGVDLFALNAACSGATCPKFSAHESNPGSFVSSSGGDNTKALYIETYAPASELNFVAGKNAALRDLGEMPLGFNDVRFKRVSANQPAITYSYDGTTNVVRNGGGFSIPYESYIIKKQHMFLVAVADPSATTISAVRYHYIFVNNTTDPVGQTGATTLDLTVRYAMADSTCTNGVCEN